MAASIPEALLGLLLVYFLPGFGVVRAMFPERRVFRPLSLRTLVEELTASLVLSVALAILIGFVWLGTSTGVQASWSQPLVELTLGLIGLVGLALAAFRGSFARIPPTATEPEPSPGEAGAFELIRSLDQIAREERRLTHRLRVVGEGSSESTAIRAELERVRAESARIRRLREAEYAQ
jgi:hypothetical protein